MYALVIICRVLQCTSESRMLHLSSQTCHKHEHGALQHNTIDRRCTVLGGAHRSSGGETRRYWRTVDTALVVSVNMRLRRGVSVRPMKEMAPSGSAA